MKDAPAGAADGEGSGSSSEPSPEPAKKKISSGFDNRSGTLNMTAVYRAEAQVISGNTGLKKYCMKFFAGQCFDPHCMQQHANTDEEKREALAKFQAIPCKFGSRCHHVTCMYAHPVGLNGQAVGNPTGRDPTRDQSRGIQ